MHTPAALKYLLTLSAAWLFPVLLGAQMLPAAPASSASLPPAPPDGGSSTVLQSIYVPGIADAPFTLTLATEWVRALGTDGNTVTVVNQRTIARDHTGRIYQQRVLLAPPPGLPAGQGVNVLQLSDPATHTYLNCWVSTHTCETLPYREAAAMPVLQAGTVHYQGSVQQTTSLGKDVLQGIDVTGMHVATVIEAGQFGNSKPVTIHREFWYSPELGINLKSTRNDPRSGQQTFTVTKISRDEPDPALFQVPDGYAVEQAAQQGSAKP